MTEITTETPVRRRGRAREPVGSPRRTVQTPGAAQYLGISASLMRSWRTRMPDDPGDKGPAFIRVSNNLVLYEISALDAWLDACRSADQRRLAQPVPASQSAAAA